MRKTANIGFSWGDEYGQPPKVGEQLERDKERVREILQHAGHRKAFDPERHYYDFHDVEVESELFIVLIEELQRDPQLTRPGSISIEKQYTQRELEAAGLLVWGPTNQAIEDDYYELHMKDEGPGRLYRRCPTCGAPLEQVREMVVNKALMGKKDVSLTYLYEVILSGRVGRLLQEHGMTGFELKPVRHFKKSYKGEPELFQLVVTHALPPMASPPTEFEHVRECEACQRRSYFLKHTHRWGNVKYYEDSDVYYPSSVLEGISDFNLTTEWFGERRVMHQWVIITQNVYRFLHEQKIRGWAAVPVCLLG